MSRYLVSVTTPEYLPQTGRYFGSIAKIRSMECRVILLDFNETTDTQQEAENALRKQIFWIDFRHLSMPKSHSYKMIQHGVFLDALPEVKDTDLICLTDMDIEIQRDFYPDELDAIEASLGDNHIGACYNGTDADRLQMEADRLDLHPNWRTKYVTDDFLRNTCCYNCGVLIARASVFRRIQTEYELLCDEFYKHTAHRSRCQFLIKYVWWRLSLDVVLLPTQVHVNGHFRNKDTGEYFVPTGVNVRYSILCYNDMPVIFRHAI